MKRANTVCVSDKQYGEFWRDGLVLMPATFSAEEPGALRDVARARQGVGNADFAVREANRRPRGLTLRNERTATEAEELAWH